MATRGTIFPRRRGLPRWLGRFGRVASCKPLGLIRGRPFRPFSRAFSSRSSAINRSCSATFLSNCTTSAFSASCDRSSMSAGAVTVRLNRPNPRRCKQNLNPSPGFCPCYESEGVKLWTPITIQRNGGYYTHDERSHLNHLPGAPRQRHRRDGRIVLVPSHQRAGDQYGRHGTLLAQQRPPRCQLLAHV